MTKTLEVSSFTTRFGFLPTVSSDGRKNGSPYNEGEVAYEAYTKAEQQAQHLLNFLPPVSNYDEGSRSRFNSISSRPSSFFWQNAVKKVLADASADKHRSFTNMVDRQESLSQLSIAY